jgi:hypothetical protein
MSFYRATLVAIATFFTVGMTSVAFAGCGGCGGWTGCGGWGWDRGCGGTSYTPMTYAEPVTTYAQPIAPAPISVGGCGCGAPRGLFVVNQGPEFSGPGIMEPYRTWNPGPQYAPAAAYPYISSYGYGSGYGYGARLGYGAGWGYGARYGYRRHFGYGFGAPGFHARPFFHGRAGYGFQRHFGPARRFYR